MGAGLSSRLAPQQSCPAPHNLTQMCASVTENCPEQCIRDSDSYLWEVQTANVSSVNVLSLEKCPSSHISRAHTGLSGTQCFTAACQLLRDLVVPALSPPSPASQSLTRVLPLFPFCPSGSLYSLNLRVLAFASFSASNTLPKACYMTGLSHYWVVKVTPPLWGVSWTPIYLREPHHGSLSQ